MSIFNIFCHQMHLTPVLSGTDKFDEIWNWCVDTFGLVGGNWCWRPALDTDPIIFGFREEPMLTAFKLRWAEYELL